MKPIAIILLQIMFVCVTAFPGYSEDNDWPSDEDDASSPEIWVSVLPELPEHLDAEQNENIMHPLANLPSVHEMYGTAPETIRSADPEAQRHRKKGWKGGIASAIAGEAANQAIEAIEGGDSSTQARSAVPKPPRRPKRPPGGGGSGSGIASAIAKEAATAIASELAGEAARQAIEAIKGGDSSTQARSAVPKPPRRPKRPPGGGGSGSGIASAIAKEAATAIASELAGEATRQAIEAIKGAVTPSETRSTVPRGRSSYILKEIAKHLIDKSIEIAVYEAIDSVTHKLN